MGVGEFLSSKATNEWILSEKRREEWEMENYPEGEIQEMIDIYTSKGMSTEDATLVIKTMAKYKDFFVDIMMSQELELQVPEEDHVQESLKEGCVMFASFALAMTVRNRGLNPGSPPPARAARVRSLLRTLKSLPRFASAAPLARLIVAHLLCPDIFNVCIKFKLVQ